MNDIVATTVKPAAGEPFIFPVRIYYEDTDFTGVVYHGQYVRFFERGRTEALRVCGVNHSDLLQRAEPMAMTVRRMQCEWLQPATLDDLLAVHTHFAEIKGARIIIRQEIWRGTEQIASANVEVACMNLDGRPRRVPAELIPLLRP